MDSQLQERLLTEYQANVELWKHDDWLRQRRIQNFLTFNTILLVSLSAFVSLDAPLWAKSVTGVAFSIIGFLICVVWFTVKVRNAEYVRFRRFQLCEIESRLKGVTTFENTYRVFYEKEKVDFKGIKASFDLNDDSGDEDGLARLLQTLSRFLAKRRSTLAEGTLPLILGGFWAIAGVVAAGVLICLGVS